MYHNHRPAHSHCMHIKYYTISVATHFQHIFSPFRSHHDNDPLPIQVSPSLPRCPALEPPFLLHIHPSSIDSIFARAAYDISVIERCFDQIFTFYFTFLPPLLVPLVARWVSHFQFFLVTILVFTFIHISSLPFPLLLPSLPVFPSLFISRCLFAAFV
jgi:hypothetical protein